MKHSSHNEGFTLVELAVVLVIIALLVGSGLSIVIGRLDVLAEKETLAKFATIEEAINGFIKQTAKRLPCPADPTTAETSSSFGREVDTSGVGSGNCTGTTAAPTGATNGRAGVVPVRTLNLPDEYMFDGWGNKITYVIDKRITATNGFTTYNLGSSVGDIAIRDTASTNRTTRAMLILISHGKNGFGAFARGSSTPSAFTTTADAANGWSKSGSTLYIANGTSFYQKAFNEGTTTSEIYDDIMIFKRRGQLRTNDE